MTIYTIEFQDRDTEAIHSVRLPEGTTEAQAIVSAETATQASHRYGVYLSFEITEPYAGYINPGTGAALVGEDWVCR